MKNRSYLFSFEKRISSKDKLFVSGINILRESTFLQYTQEGGIQHFLNEQLRKMSKFWGLAKKSKFVFFSWYLQKYALHFF